MGHSKGGETDARVRCHGAGARAALEIALAETGIGAGCAAAGAAGSGAATGTVAAVGFGAARAADRDTGIGAAGALVGNTAAAPAATGSLPAGITGSAEETALPRAAPSSPAPTLLVDRVGVPIGEGETPATEDDGEGAGERAARARRLERAGELVPAGGVHAVRLSARSADEPDVPAPYRGPRPVSMPCFCSVRPLHLGDAEVTEPRR